MEEMTTKSDPLHANNYTDTIATDYLDYAREAQTIIDVGTFINKYYLWVLFALGFPGNCAAILTIFRMRSIGTVPVFVVMLAIVDSLAIFIKVLFYQLLNHNIDMGNVGCCLLRFLGSWTSAYSSWILVIMALERFAAVRFPLRMTLHGVCTNGKTITLLVIVGAVIALFYLPQLWINETQQLSNLQCKVKGSYNAFMKIYHWITVSVYALVPFCLLSVFNCLIARQIHSSLRVRSVMRNMQLMPYNQGGFDLSIQRQVNLMLLSATVVFVVLTFPICIYVLAEPHWIVGRGYFRSKATRFLCQQLAFVLVDSTHAVNFYLYFLTARRFRHHFLRLVTCKVCYCSIKTVCQHAKGNNQSDLENL